MVTKTYNILYSSFNVWIYCSRNNIPIQEVSEEALTLLTLIFPKQIQILSVHETTNENL